MKVKCNLSELRKALVSVVRAVPNQPTHPIISHVLLLGKSNQLELTGFDLSIGVVATIDADVVQPDTLTVPGKLFADIINKLTVDELELQTLNTDSVPVLEIISSSGNFRLNGCSGKEYPNLPVITDETLSFTLPIKTVLEGIKQTTFASSSDETKQVLTGVHFAGNNTDLEMAATDGHRLSVFHAIAEESDLKANTMEVTIPSRTLQYLEKMIEVKKANELVVSIDDDHISFVFGGNRLISRRLSGEYPRYNQLIPTKFENKLTVNRKSLLASLDVVSVLSDKNNVKFIVDKTTESLTVTAESQTGNAKQLLPIEYDGENIEMGFNITYLIEGLKALSPSDEVIMSFNGAIQPVVFSPIDCLSALYLVMPIQLRS